MLLLLYLCVEIVQNLVLFFKMAPEEDVELTQTQSQTVEENYFTQSGPIDERDVWGRLLARHQSFANVGEFQTFSCRLFCGQNIGAEYCC